MMNASELILAPLGTLYSAAIRARLALYRKGALRIHKINSPVISVGNITTGGTGKTPLVEWIARTGAKEGRRVCILTRGYGRANTGKRVLVSNGERVLADEMEGGDEPRFLAEALRGVASVISDADRVAAALWAEENLRTNLFILDDGFQNLRIERDLDVVAIDSTSAWGGGRMLPSGRLREPLGGLTRADLVILTRAEQSEEIESLRKRAERLSGGRPVLICRTRTKAILPLNSMAEVGDVTSLLSPQESPITSLPTNHVAAFCGVGNPMSFFTHLRNEGSSLNYVRAFPDHYVYHQSDIDAVVAEAKRLGASVLLTTGKDAVKLRSLRFDIPCNVVQIELEFDDEEKLMSMIREAIDRS
jgi:tetraacyldisaccharide 4'-kinase